MVRDAYANYVVQTAIDVVPEGTEKRMLIDELKANEAHLVSFLHHFRPYICHHVTCSNITLQLIHL
jgi:hypothetical protein